MAAILADWRDRLNGNVRFIFQPAEEMPPGGALPMIENGALDGVATIFGLHVDPLVPVGKIGLRDGAAMAWVYDFDLIIRGKSAHVCRPDACVDAIVTAAEVIDSLQKIVSRETDPLSPIVVSIGKIEGGSARNVIADEVRMVGTVRTLSAKMLKRLPRIIRRIVGGVCRARGATFEISDIASYPGLYNDIKTNRLFSHNYESLFGKNRVVEIEPTLGGEDFACYVQKVPGAMFRVGIGNKKIGADKPWHSPEFIADEKSLVHATALLVSSTLDYLDRHKE
ncbi:MAG: amidohydrolase [Candidatus Zixiibacteriota bacterium]|nr:MAG: amidohydrolase [candidate division Zixibacteria bacterium]